MLPITGLMADFVHIGVRVGLIANQHRGIVDHPLRQIAV
jgi:hypothetical protein